MGRITTRRKVLRLNGGEARPRPDTLAGEEPLEIRLGGRPLTVTMRTPGHDFDLVAGFLVSEGMVAAAGELGSLRYCAGADPDGENTYNTNSTFLKSEYSAWGYISRGHLGTTSTSMVIQKMNERTALACTNIKAAGIKIYTIAFQVTDTATLQMLTNCANEPAMAYQSSSTSGLTAAFKAIVGRRR